MIVFGNGVYVKNAQKRKRRSKMTCVYVKNAQKRKRRSKMDNIFGWVLVIGAFIIMAATRE
jgi:hypothetical protein